MEPSVPRGRNIIPYPATNREIVKKEIHRDGLENPDAKDNHKAQSAGQGRRSTSATRQPTAERQALKEIMERYVFVAESNGYISRADALKPALKPQAFTQEIAAEYSIRKRDGSGRIWTPTIKMAREAGLPHVRTIGFAPDEAEIFENEAGDKVLNSYRAPKWTSEAIQVSSATREAAQALFLDHITYLCNGNREAAGHILDWMAHLVQKPAERVNHAIIITSPVQGVGKSLLGEIMRALVNPAHARRMTPQSFKRDFNERMAGALACVVDEIYERENWDLANVLKPYITESTTELNGKYRALAEVPIYARFMLLSNHDVPLPLEEHDRRFFVIRCTQEKRAAEFYERFGRAIESDEGKQAIYDYLRARDISSFKPKAAPPMTQAKRDIIDGSGNPVAAFLLERMATGELWEALPNPFTCAHLTAHMRDKGVGNYGYNRALVGEGLKQAGFEIKGRAMVAGRKVSLYTHPEWPPDDDASDSRDF